MEDEKGLRGRGFRSPRPSSPPPPLVSDGDQDKSPHLHELHRHHPGPPANHVGQTLRGAQWAGDGGEGGGILKIPRAPPPPPRVRGNFLGEGLRRAP